VRRPRGQPKPPVRRALIRPSQGEGE
jgi:hypothetical protein